MKQFKELFDFLAKNPRDIVTLSYKDSDGTIIPAYRRLPAPDTEAIRKGIEKIMALNVDEMKAKVYRPNGTSEIEHKTFIIKLSNTAKPASRGLGSLFEQEETFKPAPMKETPSFTPPPTGAMDWKDYALSQEQQKVMRLENEVSRLMAENKTLDSKVREHEKEEIRKQNELEKLAVKAEGKTGLGGFIGDIASDPESKKMALETVREIASALRGGSAQPQGQLASDNIDPETLTMLEGIKTWMLKNPAELRAQLYTLIAHVTNQKEVSATIIKLIQLLENGRVLKKTA